VRTFCEDRGWKVRIIQLENENDIYKKLSGDAEKPDIAIAYNMPSGVYAVKKYSAETGVPILAVSWLDASVGNMDWMERRDFEYLRLADMHFVSGRLLHSEIRMLFPDSHIFDVVGMGELPSVGEGETLDKNAHFISEAGFDNVGGALADFEYKLHEIVEHPQAIFKIKEYGNLYCGDKISVILPCYNVEKYVEECIESLVASSLPLYMLELIFVDDASPDGTSQIVKRYESEYPDNILIVECEQNGGLSIARNIGMQYSSGNYIGFVDPDDMVDRDMYRKLYEKCALYKCDMTACEYCEFSNEGDKRIPYISEENFYLLDISDEKKSFIITEGTQMSVCRKLYRRELIEKNKIDFPKHRRMEDIYFTTLCVMCAQRCYVIGEPLYLYRKNSTSIMHSDNMSKYYMDTYYVIEMAYNELKNRGLLSGFEDEFAVNYYVQAFTTPLSRMMMSSGKVEVSEENINMARNSVLKHFPNITDNLYIKSDKSEYNMWFLSLLKQ
jgi:glycosyltransferase involved in cell wall biosynthesis